MVSKLVSALAVATGLFATSALAEGNPEWKTVGDWQIVVDKTTKGCIMQKTYDTGLLLQFGFLPERDGGFFAVYRQEWTDIQYGKRVPVKFFFDGDEYQGDATGTITKPWYGGYAFVNNPELVYEFAKKYVMVVQGPNNTFELSLDGTLNGVKELEACQAAQIG